MNNKVTSNVAIIALLAFLVSCASTSNQRSDPTLSIMNEVQSDIASIMNDVDTIQTSLNRLKDTNQGEISEAFNEYSDNLDRLNDNSSQLTENMDEMSENAEEYFSQWRNDNYDNPQIREISSNRRIELENSYQEIEEAYSDLERELNSYISTNNDLRSLLSNDLTATGIRSVTQVIDETINDSQNLKNTLADVQSAIEQYQRRFGDVVS